jgi:hypothetical protein
MDFCVRATSPREELKFRPAPPGDGYSGALVNLAKFVASLMPLAVAQTSTSHVLDRPLVLWYFLSVPFPYSVFLVIS